MRPARDWVGSVPHVWDTELHEQYVLELVKDVRLEAINAAADVVRDTKEYGAEELAKYIVETLTRGA